MAVMLIVAPTPTLGQVKHDVKMTRRMPVGTTYRVSATGSIERTGTRAVNGRVEPVPSQTMNVSLVATGRVAEVAPDGRATRIDFKIDRCDAAMNGGERRTLVPGGKTLIARQQGDELTFEIAGEGRIRDARTQALSSVIRMPTARTQFDESFGPGKAVVLGDAWRVNEAAYRKELAASGMDASEAKIDGRVTLADAAEGPLGKVYEVSGKVTTTGLKSQQAVDGVGPERSNLSLVVEFAVRAPSDVRRPILNESGRVDIRMRLAGVGPDGQPMTIDALIRRTLSLTRTPIE